jgi:uncharacterized protein (DUF983 family)
MAPKMTDSAITSPQERAPEPQARPFWLGVRRGLAHRCPECGKGRLYSGYLKVDHFCEVCRHPLGEYRADDGPAYVTILLVGHLVVAPLLLFPFIWQWPAAVVVPLTLGPLAALILMTLPRIKGAFLGALWATKAGSLEEGVRD